MFPSFKKLNACSLYGSEGTGIFHFLPPEVTGLGLSCNKKTPLLLQGTFQSLITLKPGPTFMFRSFCSAFDSCISASI